MYFSSTEKGSGRAFNYQKLLEKVVQNSIKTLNKDKK